MCSHIIIKMCKSYSPIKVHYSFILLNFYTVQKMCKIIFMVEHLTGMVFISYSTSLSISFMLLLQWTETQKDSEMAVHVLQCSNRGKGKQVHFMVKHPYYLEDWKSEQF